jgi:hypothetical protein
MYCICRVAGLVSHRVRPYSRYFGAGELQEDATYGLRWSRRCTEVSSLAPDRAGKLQTMNFNYTESSI